MIYDINLSENYSFKAAIFRDDGRELGEATISFGKGNLIKITLADNFKLKSSDLITETLKARTADTQIFTIFKCEVRGWTIFGEYLLNGDIDEQFKEINFELSEISDWFLADQRLEGRIGNQLTWTNRPPNINAQFKINNEKILLSSEIVGSIKKGGAELDLRERINFKFYNEDGFFDFKSAEERAIELCQLLSLITDFPQAITKVSIKTEKGVTYAAYIPSLEEVERKSEVDDFLLERLTQRRELDGRWENIFKNYYISPHQETWIRLAGMLRYEGFWEYKILGYISLLDKFVKNFVARKNINVVASGRLKKIRNILTNSKPKIDSKQIESIIQDVKATLTSKRRPTFTENFKSAVAHTDPGIIKIISISGEDFHTIKKIRDNIAHGESIETETRYIDNLQIIMEKVKLLLTFWAFQDLGFGAQEFATMLAIGTRRIPRLLRDNLNKAHLARITKTAEFIQVEPEQLAALMQIENIAHKAFIVIDKQGNVTYSKEFHEKYTNWMVSPKQGHSKHSDIFDIEEDKVRYAPTAYIESGEEFLELIGAYIFET